VNDASATNQNTPVVIDVLANDTMGGLPVDRAAVTVNFPPSLAPRNGTLVLNGDKTVTYTPNNGFYGSESVGYQVNAGGVLSNMATISIQVNAVENIILRRGIANARGRLAATRGPRWVLMGKGTPGTNVSFHLGPDTTGEFIGSATVNKRGLWRFVGRTPITQPLDGLSSVSILSSAGGTLVNQPLRVFLPRPPRSLR
jgi:hypothetical protein